VVLASRNGGIFVITERTRTKFAYDADGKVEDADFLLTEFATEGDASALYNSRFLAGPVKYVATEYPEQQEAIIKEAFCKLLRKEDPTPDWTIEAIQPIPGALIIQLRHTGAFILDFDGEESAMAELGEMHFAEAERIFELFNGYTATITYRVTEQPESWGDFVLDIDSDSSVVFDVQMNKTAVLVKDRKFPQTSREYVLTWKSKKHKKFYADITTTFSLESDS